MKAQLCLKYPAYDGTLLAADVYTPDGPGPFPVVLTRTPYNRVGHLAHNAKQFVDRGYAYVATDCRGRYESGGQFTRMFDEAEDGQATIDWVADQAWCNGRVGLWGLSYGGVFQVPAAIGQHEALRCICPSVITSRFFETWSRYDGSFALQNPLWWIMGQGAGRTTPSTVHIDMDALYRMKSLDEIERAIGYELPMLREIVDRDVEDAWWKTVDQWPMHKKVSVPGMHTAGWFDHVSRGQYEAYRRISDHGATEKARAGQRLFVGPWYHLIFKTGDEHRRYGTWDFGESADFPVIQHHLRFLDLYLKDMDDGIASEPPVRVFLLGENRWIDLPDWPAPDTETQKWRLGSKGNSHGIRGGGTLSRDEPTTQGSSELIYDPQNPVPTCGGQIFWNMDERVRGPRDQRHLLERDDMLYYQSDLLDKPLTVMGEVDLDLCIATDVEDTDIVAKLCVVESDGSVTCIIVGSFRCRYRDGFDRYAPLVPGEPAAIKVRLAEIAYTFPVGSRIAVSVTSSDFPRIQPHTNTMAKPFAPVQPVIAHTQILHGPGSNSALNLPIVDLS